MDESPNDLSLCTEDSLTVEQDLSSGIEQIFIEPDMRMDQLDNRCENKDTVMTEIDNQSKIHESIEASSNSSLNEANKQCDDVSNANICRSQWIRGHVDRNRNQNQTRSYQSYSNLIRMHCSKCKIISKNVAENTCYKCQSSLHYQCIKCNSLHKKYIVILNHIKYECYKQSVFYCSVCNYNTALKPSLYEHLEKQHSSFKNSENSHCCSFCKKRFTQQHHMLRHEKICGKRPALSCQYCPFKTKLNDILVQHIDKEHYIPNYMMCLNCGKEYRDPKLLHHHVKYTCGTVKPFQCNHCDFNVHNKFALTKHIQQVHEFLFTNNNDE